MGGGALEPNYPHPSHQGLRASPFILKCSFLLRATFRAAGAPVPTTPPDAQGTSSQGHLNPRPSTHPEAAQCKNTSATQLPPNQTHRERRLSFPYFLGMGKHSTNMLLLSLTA